MLIHAQLTDAEYALLTEILRNDEQSATSEEHWNAITSLTSKLNTAQITHDPTTSDMDQ